MFPKVPLCTVFFKVHRALYIHVQDEPMKVTTIFMHIMFV